MASNKYNNNKDNYNTIAQNTVNNCEAFAIISKTYGNEGEMLVKLNADISKNINPVDVIAKKLNEPLWTIINSIAVPLFVESIYQLGNSKAVIVFQDFQDNNVAKLLLTKKLYSDKIIPQKEEQHEFVNYKIIDNITGKEFTVIEVVETPMNILLEVVDSDQNEFTIPLAEQLIDKHDKKAKVISMNLPEGIFEL